MFCWFTPRSLQEPIAYQTLARLIVVFDNQSLMAEWLKLCDGIRLINIKAVLGLLVGVASAGQ